MTSINLDKPQEGARLDFSLMLTVTKETALTAFGRKSPTRIQLANKGGAIPVLTVEAGRLTPRVLFYDPSEGHEIESKALPLSRYALTTISERR